MLLTDDAAMKKQDIENLLDLLKDGKWYTAEKIMDKTRINEYKAKLMISFLQEFQFIQVDKKSGRIKLTISAKRFLENLEKTDAASYEEIMA
jgi:predicted transcriptional regulator